MDNEKAKGLVVDIRKATLYNSYFRREMWTGEHLQITVMTIPVDGEIGLERHESLDQVLVLEQGRASVHMGDKPDDLSFMGDAEPGCGILIPAGTYHNVYNKGRIPLKLFSVYAPPNHPIGTIDRTKEEADRRENNDSPSEEQRTLDFQ